MLTQSLKIKMKAEIKLKYNEINTDCTDNGTQRSRDGLTRRRIANSPKVSEEDIDKAPLSSREVHGGIRELYPEEDWNF